MSLTCRFPGGPPARTPCCSKLPSPDDHDYDDAVDDGDVDGDDDHDYDDVVDDGDVDGDDDGVLLEFLVVQDWDLLTLNES